MFVGCSGLRQFRVSSSSGPTQLICVEFELMWHIKQMLEWHKVPVFYVGETFELLLS